MINAITGWNVTIAEILTLGERRLNLLRAFNAREGIGRSDDQLPKKMFQYLTGGPSDGIALTEVELEAALDQYYQLAGWQVATGMPTREKLEELYLAWVLD